MDAEKKTYHQLERNAPLKVCYVLRRDKRLGNVQPGERCSLRPAVADQLAAAGCIELLTEAIKPQEITDAGGIDNFLRKAEKARKLSAQQAKNIERQFERTTPPKPRFPRDQQV